MNKKCTIFCDIDGTLIKYREFSTYKSLKAEPINSTVKEINRAFNKGHTIVLTTARPSRYQAGLYYQYEFFFLF